MSLKQYGKPNNVIDGVITQSDGDVDGVQRLLGPDVVATGCPCQATAPHHVPRLRINVSGQPFELPVALLARHPGEHAMQNSVSGSVGQWVMGLMGQSVDALWSNG